MESIAILLVGAADALAQSLPGDSDLTVRPVRDVAEAVAAAHEQPPDVFVLLQRQRGEYRADEFEQLRRAAPLAPIVVVAESWCEGEIRSAPITPGVLRIYRHQWPARVASALAAWRRGEPGEWSLPTTATEEERVLASTPVCKTLREDGTVLVHSSNREVLTLVQDLCRSEGWECRTVRLDDQLEQFSADAVVLDLPTVEQADSLIADNNLGSSAVPLVVLASFPRPGDIDRMRLFGAAAVLSKPWRVEELTATLRSLMKADVSLVR